MFTQKDEDIIADACARAIATIKPETIEAEAKIKQKTTLLVIEKLTKIKQETAEEVAKIKQQTSLIIAEKVAKIKQQTSLIIAEKVAKINQEAAVTVAKIKQEAALTVAKIKQETALTVAKIKKRTEDLEKKLITVRYNIFMEERKIINKLTTKSCKNTIVWFVSPPPGI
jgi:hypothetical protein